MDEKPSVSGILNEPAPPSETPVFYANASRSVGGAFDVRIEFALQRGNDDPSWVAGVVMSWEHAQALAQSLERMLTDFQARAGPLPNPERSGAITGGAQ
jgi:Protein of unknown function (DUF3467)